MKRVLNLLIFCFCFYQAHAQTPGGVGNVEVEYWLSADQMGNLDLNDGQDVLFWKDYSGKNRDFENTNGFAPRYLKSFMNYHNAVDFYANSSLSSNDNSRRKLTSVNNFSLDVGKAYYVIYVSRLENNNYTSSATNATVLSLLGSSSANYGWIAGTGPNGKKQWHQTRVTNYISSDLTQQYGIAIVQVPNTSSGTAQQQILNALPSSTSMAARLISTSAADELSIIGGNNASGSSYSNSFSGQIMEIIVLSRPSGSVLNAQELAKINSALALKYGISLSEQQNQYVLADGTVVFDGSNAGYSSYKKDVFGLARDDASGLYQKQSASTGNNALAVSLGEFMDSNKENTSVLDNKQAIVFGTNGLLGTTTYNHSNGTSFLNYTLGSGPGGPENITDRYNKIYRAKTTGKSSFTLEVSAGMGDWLLVGSSANFEPNQTRIYKVKNGLCKDVSINDGDFIGFAFTEQNFIGGVQNVAVEFWLSADNIGLANLQDGSPVNSWLDKSGQTRDFINTTGSTPKYSSSAMNYHPAVEFYKDEESSDLVNNTRKLQSRENFTAYSDRSYFAIYVSRLDNDSYTNASQKASVFSINDGATTGWVGGTGSNATKMLYLNNTTMSDFTSEGYGISIYSIPNKSGSSATNPQMFLNGLRSTSSLSKIVLKSTPDLSVIGAGNAQNSASNPFYGEVMEVILISRPGGSNGVELSSEELNKINSHLAIKYGITLDLSQNKYVLSDNTVIYDMQNQSYSGYTKDIVGIARDDQGGLYQKQSKNTSNASLAISKGEFQETNQENNSILTDKTALVLGANGQEGKLVYSHPVGTSFANYTLQVYTDPITGVVHQEKLSTIFSYKMRAKVTGKSSYTINARIGLGSWLVVSPDINFAPSQTRIYKLEDGEIKNVLINDGDYVGFAFDAVAPGGVFDGLRMWLNASQKQTISTNSRGEVTNWSDYSGNGTSYRRKAANNSAPLYLQYEERTNFHPTPLFSSKKDYLITDKAAMSVASPENVSFYAVVNHNFATDRSYFIGFGNQKHAASARRPAFGVYRGSASNTDGFGRIGSTGLTNSPGRLFTTGATTIAGYHWKVGTEITFEFDGGHSQTTNHVYRNVMMNGPGMLGLGSSSDSYYLQGVMPEVILYERQLNENEKTRINSYLGLKYAITIDLDKNSSAKNFNYLLSNNQSIWNGDDAIHRNYHNNVTSVVRDDVAGLYNKQAKSTNVGSMLHMGVGSKLGTDPELGNILVDRSAITWGHNNAQLTTTNIGDLTDICGVFDSKLSGRVWLVDNTNFDQSILVQAGGIGFPYDGPSWDVTMLVADSPDKISQNSWDAAIPMAFQDGVHKVNYKFDKDKVTYISFAAKEKDSHCIPCEFQGVKTLSFNNQNWPRGSKSNTYDLGDQFQAKVNVSIEGPSSFYGNFYPRAFSYNSLRQLRTRKAGTNKMTTEIVLSQNGAGVSAQASFEIFDIDRSGNRFEHVEVYGLCSDGKVSPVLSYVQTEQRSSYTIQGNKAIGNKRYSGYTSKNGRMHVEFDTPVEKIYIVQTYTGAPNSGLSSLGVGPIDFACVPLPPPPNEEGLIFTKQAPFEANLCDEVSFTFRVTNLNCFAYSVNFQDILPQGMKWVEESLSLDANELQGATVNDYKDSNTLSIDGLTIPGSSTLTFRARAVFDENAVAGVYENQAKMSYTSHLDSSKIKELLSCDRFQEECSATRTNVTGDPSFRPLPMEIVDFSLPVLCYSAEEEMLLSWTLKNPNAFDIDQMSVYIDFNPEFSFVTNSLSSPTVNLASATLDSSEQGVVIISDFDIPPGEHTIYIKLKSPNLEDVQMEDIDPSNPSLGKKPMDLYLSYEFLSESLDICLSQTTKDAYGSVTLPYCDVCYYEPVIGDSGNIFQEDAFFGVSSLNRDDSSWMSTRSNGFVVLESTTKGFVVTRLTNTQMESLSPVEGMLIYNTTLECLMLYNGQKWGCLVQGCVDE